MFEMKQNQKQILNSNGETGKDSIFIIFALKHLENNDSFLFLARNRPEIGISGLASLI